MVTYVLPLMLFIAFCNSMLDYIRKKAYMLFPNMKKETGFFWVGYGLALLPLE